MVVYIDTITCTFYETEGKTLQNTIDWKSKRHFPGIFIDTETHINNDVSRDISTNPLHAGLQPSISTAHLSAHPNTAGLQPSISTGHPSNHPNSNVGTPEDRSTRVLKRNWTPLMRLWTVSKWTCYKLRW